MQPNANDALRQAKASRVMHRRWLALFERNATIAKALFLDETGQLSKDGQRLLVAMAREARMHRHGFEGSADRRLFDAGAQHMVRWLADLIDIDSRKLAQAMNRLDD